MDTSVANRHLYDLEVYFSQNIFFLPGKGWGSEVLYLHMH